ncbi:acyltransferase [Devosia soli]|uniref:acyltransferase n=1 Tax=Devosia soli TaxID=361041 RepID=UPI000699C37C|nr:acyltransferase [Devosia soli]
MSAYRPGHYLTKGIDRLFGAVRALWYRRVYLAWVDFGHGVTFAGTIHCPGVTGTVAIGDRSYLGHGVSLAVAEGGRITVGPDVSINKGCTLSARRAVSIGGGTRIGDHTSILDSDHRLDPDVPILESGFETRPIVIGANVWIGRQVTILPGVTVGDHAVIGAHSLVNADVPPRGIAFGTPARLHRIRP